MGHAADGQGAEQQEHGAAAEHAPAEGQSQAAGRSPVVAAARAVSALAHGHRPGTGREHQGRRRADWSRYKIQAMVTLVPPADDAAGPVLAGPSCRAVIRAQHHGTHGGKLFNALIDIRDDFVVPDAEHLVVTAVVLGEDARDYLDVGDHFALWRGSDIGQGVVTRRIFV